MHQMMMQHQQNTAVVCSGNGDRAIVSLMSTTSVPQSQSRPSMMNSSFFAGPNSLFNCCRFWSLTPGPQQNYHNQVSWMKPFGSERFRVVSILLKLLIGCVLLNLLLTSWIIVSLRLHKNTNPLRYGSGQRNSNTRRTPVTLSIDGSLTAKQNLQVKNVEVANGGIFGVASTADQLTLTTRKDTHNQSSSLDTSSHPQLPQSITLSGHAFEVKTTNFEVEENGATTFQLTPTTLSFESGVDQQLKAPPGGLRLTAKLDTTEVRSDARQEFHIESRTGALQLSSQQAIEVESMSSGDSPSTLVKSYDALQLNVVSSGGGDDQHHLHFDSANVQMGHLRGSGGGQHYEEQQHHHHQWRHQHHHHQQGHHQKVSGSEEAAAYQLCVCGSGHLFATTVEGVCEADQTVCES